jgi:hypothetical protein
MSETLQPTVSSTLEEFHLISDTDGHLGNVVRRSYTAPEQPAEYQLSFAMGLWPEESVRALGHHLLGVVGDEPAS